VTGKVLRVAVRAVWRLGGDGCGHSLWLTEVGDGRDSWIEDILTQMYIVEFGGVR